MRDPGQRLGRCRQGPAPIEELDLEAFRSKSLGGILRAGRAGDLPTLGQEPLTQSMGRVAETEAKQTRWCLGHDRWLGSRRDLRS